MDTRSIGPAESFIADTVVPPVVLLPLKGDCADHASHCCGKEGEIHLRDVPGLLPRNAGRGRVAGTPAAGRRATLGLVRADSRMATATARRSTASPATHRASRCTRTAIALARPRIRFARTCLHGSADPHPHRSRPWTPVTATDPPLEPGKKVRLRGDFLVHCHVEMHMMEGMAALVRSIQTMKVTKELASAYCFELPRRSSRRVSDRRSPPLRRRRRHVGAASRLADLHRACGSHADRQSAALVGNGGSGRSARVARLGSRSPTR